MIPSDTYSLSTRDDRPAIEITRWFPASPRMYTDPRHLVTFLGSEGCTHPVCEIDLRPGSTGATPCACPTAASFPRSGPSWKSTRRTASPMPSRTRSSARSSGQNAERNALRRQGRCLVAVRVECLSLAAHDAMIQRGFAASVRKILARLQDFLAQQDSTV